MGISGLIMFDVFLTKPVGVNENVGGWESPRGMGLNPTPDKSSTVVVDGVVDDDVMMIIEYNWRVHQKKKQFDWLN